MFDLGNQLARAVGNIVIGARDLYEGGWNLSKLQCMIQLFRFRDWCSQIFHSNNQVDSQAAQPSENEVYSYFIERAIKALTL